MGEIELHMLCHDNQWAWPRASLRPVLTLKHIYAYANMCVRLYLRLCVCAYKKMTV